MSERRCKHERDLAAHCTACNQELVDAAIRAAVLAERKAVLRFVEAERHLYIASSKRCDAAGNTTGGALDAVGAVTWPLRHAPHGAASSSSCTRPRWE